MRKVLIIALFAVVMLCVFTSCSFGKTEESITPEIVGEIAENSQNCKVYIRENDEYIPYFVITNNYNNNTLLMREKPLEDKMPMNNKYKINYYPDSDLDYYLNNSFINKFSNTMKDIIVNTKIEVTAYDTLNGSISKRETEFINRKIFLLSASECGIRSTMATEEGEKTENIDKFISSDRQWLRSAYLWNYDSFWVIGDEQGSDRAENSLSVHPVFTIPFDTEVEQSEDML
ncbi:MAG: DUF6273 domain-containing protein [Acutalibacteraceae bacterium]|nr:DUF6273 domain-containing protein [Acutalibacteraceae bacterium]